MVSFHHPDYNANFHKWKLIRDTIAGDVRAYVPKLEGQSDKEYQAYVNRPSFYNATSRTLDALVGLMFSKDPEFKAPKALEDIAKNITLNGDTLNDFSKLCVRESLQTARNGILVDMPSVYRANFSKADEEKLNLRSYARLYKAESIINWDTYNHNGVEILSQVVLEETYLKSKNEFEKELKTRWRVLDLDEGKYRQRVFETDDLDDKKINQIGEDAIIIINGSTIDYIPFFFFGVNTTKPDIEKSPIFLLNSFSRCLIAFLLLSFAALIYLSQTLST